MDDILNHKQAIKRLRNIEAEYFSRTIKFIKFDFEKLIESDIDYLNMLISIHERKMIKLTNIIKYYKTYNNIKYYKDLNYKKGYVGYDIEKMKWVFRITHLISTYTLYEGGIYIKTSNNKDDLMIESSLM